MQGGVEYHVEKGFLQIEKLYPVTTVKNILLSTTCDALPGIRQALRASNYFASSPRASRLRI